MTIEQDKDNTYKVVLTLTPENINNPLIRNGFKSLLIGNRSQVGDQVVLSSLTAVGNRDNLKLFTTTDGNTVSVLDWIAICFYKK